MRRLLSIALLAIFLLIAACSGDDSTSSTTPSGSASTSGGIATLTGLQAQLASVLLQSGDVQAELDRSSPAFSTNNDVAGDHVDVLATLVQEGRQLGVDVQFIPTDKLDPSSPLRGGIQSSASVYTKAEGAAQSYTDTAAQARANDWAANYPDLIGIKVTEVPKTFGDESVWLRIAGNDCTPRPAAGSSQPTCGPNGQKIVVLDNLVVRIGRVRAFLQVSSLFPGDSAPDIYEDQISQWAQSVVQHAKAAFPGS